MLLHEGAPFIGSDTSSTRAHTGAANEKWQHRLAEEKIIDHQTDANTDEGRPRGFIAAFLLIRPINWQCRRIGAVETVAIRTTMGSSRLTF